MRAPVACAACCRRARITPQTSPSKSVPSMLDEQLTDWLEKTLTGAGGGNCPVSLIYRQPENQARVKLGERWQVLPSDELLQELRDGVGNERVALQYVMIMTW